MLRGIVISQSLGVLLNTVSVSFRGIKVASDVIPRIGDKVACSAGAACHSLESQSVSSVLLAIQVLSPLSLLVLSLSHSVCLLYLFSSGLL
jgi:cysteine sulfinate desulfinase/cysteine desulfurase-like protein